MTSTDVSTEPKIPTSDQFLTQPHCWSLRLIEVAASQALPAVFTHLGLPARALPASERLLHPNVGMPKDRSCIPS